MNISHFFIDRPIFAAVLSIVITLLGGISLLTLSVEQYPDIVPPTVVVTATYSGANAATVASTVAAPIEQQVNGVENLLYMSSQSSNDGTYTLTCTFKLGTDLDTAQVLVQNRVSLAEANLPTEVTTTGVSVTKQSPSMIMCVSLISPDNSRDELYLSNYALLQIKDTLARLDGVGSITLFGYEYSMRIWLDPGKLASLDLTASDVITAVTEQNKQVAAGIVGQEPAPSGTDFQIVVAAKGRLVEPEEFADIIIKRGSSGQLVRIRDVGSVELGAETYSVSSNLDGQPAASLAIYQNPGSNSLSTAQAVNATMEDLKKAFPAGVDYTIAYDTTTFVTESIHSVQHTLIEAIILVALVVLVFLQTWRAAIIPLVAVPVSLIGTFAAMAAFGFSLNVISLFGIVLAIGIVVDDAIVVVEAMEKKLSLGLSPREAAVSAMNEVGGAVVAVALVLGAVFIPTAFMGGITGEFFRQFALTIAVSTVISAFNSLTLSPALGVLLLRPHGQQNDWLSRLLNVLLGPAFRGFNRLFDWLTESYGRLVSRLLRVAVVGLVLYVGLLVLTIFGFKITPSGFIPTQDQGYLIVSCQLPDAASLPRTVAVTTKVREILKEIPGVKTALYINGFSMLSGSNQTNTATILVMLDAFGERKAASLGASSILETLRTKLAGIPEAVIVPFNPPSIQGLGTTGGFKLMIQDRASGGFDQLQAAAESLVAGGSQQPALVGLNSTFRSDSPEIFVDIDRTKAKSMNIPLTNVFTTLQVYLSSYYINDFTYLGRTFQVNAQAASTARVEAADILRLKTRNADGGMVSLGAVATITDSFGPSTVTRYNLYNAADVSGDSAAGYSSGQAITVMEQLGAKLLPPGFTFEWTDLTYQQIIAGNTTAYIFALCVLLVFLTLAAQYESWSLPFAIILIVPMCLLSSLAGVLLRDQDNNIFTQIGFVVLVGLSCKNAILIVEFAKQIEGQGKDAFTAVIEACKLRLRPILMTSFAFIAGVVPLMLATGAGAEMRQALGTAVFFGMLGVTFFGLFFTPVFYLIIRRGVSLGKARIAPAKN